MPIIWIVNISCTVNERDSATKHSYCSAPPTITTTGNRHFLPICNGRYACVSLFNLKSFSWLLAQTLSLPLFYSLHSCVCVCVCIRVFGQAVSCRYTNQWAISRNKSIEISYCNCRIKSTFPIIIKKLKNHKHNMHTERRWFLWKMQKHCSVLTFCTRPLAFEKKNFVVPLFCNIFLSGFVFAISLGFLQRIFVVVSIIRIIRILHVIVATGMGDVWHIHIQILYKKVYTCMCACVFAWWHVYLVQDNTRWAYF